jgi:hypothetical protein
VVQTHKSISSGRLRPKGVSLGGRPPVAASTPGIHAIEVLGFHSEAGAAIVRALELWTPKFSNLRTIAKTYLPPSKEIIEESK